MYDWAHVYVCDGLLGDELGECMSTFKTARARDTSYAEMGTYIGRWRFPSNRGMATLLTEKKIRSHHNARAFSSTASELLTITPIVLRYFKEVVMHRGRFIAQCRSLIACLQVVLLLMACRLCVVRPEVLAEAITRHMNLFKEAYGDARCGQNIILPCICSGCCTDNTSGDQKLMSGDQKILR